MAEPSSAEKLTSWAAGSQNRAFQYVRTTLGPLLLILFTPPAAIIFWIVCTFEPFNGSLAPLFSAAGWQSVAAHWPWPSWSAGVIILIFVAVEVILLQGLPGKVFEGPITPSGNRPRYKLNGVIAWFITLALFLGCSFGLHLFNAGIVWDHFGEILATLVLFALVFCLFLYFKGRYRPSSEDHSLSGNFIWDYYWGVELHPRLFGVDLKQLINCRFSMMGWGVIVCSFAAKQAELDPGGHASNAMLVSVGITLIYLLRFFRWESGYFTSLDVMHDRFGYYICWGVMAWVPAVYTLTAQYLVLRPNNLTWPLAAGIFVLGVSAVVVNYAADAQRQRVRATNGATRVWGSPPELIRASLTTADGKEHENILLASGWWGLARHFHYMPRSYWRWPGACRPVSATSCRIFTWSTWPSCWWTGPAGTTGAAGGSTGRLGRNTAGGCPGRSSRGSIEGELKVVSMNGNGNSHFLGARDRLAETMRNNAKKSEKCAQGWQEIASWRLFCHI